TPGSVTRTLAQRVMPIVDWDSKHYRWYVMPLGKRVMSDLPIPIPDDLLRSIMDDVLSALELAHASGHPHRDIKPSNIIDLDGWGGHAWVLADWGLTRRPLGKTTMKLTSTGTILGTE